MFLVFAARTIRSLKLSLLFPILTMILALTQVAPVAHLSSASYSDTWYDELVSTPVLMASQLARESVRLTSASGSDVQVTFDPDNMSQNEPSIAINPMNSSNLVAGANDYRLTASVGSIWLGVYTSMNGGLSWSNRLIPGFPGDSPGALSDFEFASDPGVAFDANGNVYYSGLVFNVDNRRGPEDGSVFVAKSSDGGTTFPQVVLVAAGSGRILFNDKPYIAVDKTLGRVYVSWTRFTSAADIMVSYSEDGGATFSSPRRVSTSPVNQGSLPIVGPAGELYVVWSDMRNGRIMMVRSTNGGASFSSPMVVSSYSPLPTRLANSRFRVNNFPAAAVDDANGNLYVAWADYRSGNADVLFSRSIDGGTTWGPLKKVNDDNTTHDQFFPWMSVASGRLSIDFYDRREDPENHLVDVFYAQSNDGGISISTNLRVTDEPFDPDAVLFGEEQVSFIGDYIGIASDATTAHLVWTDHRNVSPDSPRNQDILTDRILTRPPNIARIDPQVGDEGQELILTVTASDPDEKQTLTLTAEWGPEGLPPGAIFTSTPSNETVMGTFTWTPDESQGGITYQVGFVASDGLLTDEKNASITVNEVNSPPMISIQGPLTVGEGSQLTLTIEVSDPDTPPNQITLSATGLPQGSDFDPDTGIISWTPDESQGPGDYSLTFTATDDGNPSRQESKTVEVHVMEVNQPPVLVVPPSQSIDEQTTLSLKVMALDPDIPTNTLSITCDNCDSIGASFDPASGTFTWTPTEEQGEGDYTVVFAVSDDGALPLHDTKTVRIHVDEVDSPPLLYAESQYSVSVGDTLRFTVTAADPDNLPDDIILSPSELAPGMSFDPATGDFSFTPSVNQAGTSFTISFTATEAGPSPLISTKTVVIKVEETGPGQNPTPPLPAPNILPWIGLAGAVGLGLSLFYWRLRRYKPR